MSNEFLTYGPNNDYATLDAYGHPYWVITRSGNRLFDCTKSFKLLNYPTTLPSLQLLLEHSNEIYDLVIPIGKNLKTHTRGSTVTKVIVKNNYFLAPWIYKPKGMEDLQAYRLCEYERFSDIKPFYFGTNYGTVWSTVAGTYASPYQNRPNKDGMAYLQYRILADHIVNGKLIDRRTVTSHWISGYFVHNSNPEYYDTLCHRDNNPSNNYYKNLYWANQKENLSQASKDNRMAKVITNEILDEIVEARNKVVQEGGSITKLYKKYANKLDITPEAIYYNIKAKIDKNRLLKAFKDSTIYNSNDFINKCTFINDYDVTYRYVVLKSFGRPDAIFTVDNRVFVGNKYNKEKTATLFSGLKTTWPLFEELSSLVQKGILVELSDPYTSIIPKQLGDSFCKYLNTGKIQFINIYKLYFSESPWYLKYAKNVKIDFIQINTNPNYNKVLPCYFLCSNGKVFSIASSNYLTSYTKKTSSINMFSLTTVDKTAINRSILTLLEDFELLSN